MFNKFLLAFSLLLVSFNVNSAYVELNSGDFWGSTDGEGTGRGISFQANEAFSISSIGIYGNLNTMSHEVVIFSSTDGHQANSLLASASRDITTTGSSDWFDIMIDFNFGINQFYTLLWRPTVSTSNWATSIDYYDDRSSLPLNIGLVTLIDGVEGFTASSFSNFLHPNLRINTDTVSAVPVPAAVWLFGSALAGFAGFSRYKKKA